MKQTHHHFSKRYAAVSTPALLTVYNAGYPRLKEALKDLTQRQMKAYPVKNKWNIFEIAFHVVFSEIQGASRIRQTITQSDRIFSYYDQDVWAKQLVTGARLSMKDLEEHLELFKFLRYTTGRILENATDNDWKKSGFHPERNADMTLRELLEYYADHSERHLDQILERRKLLGRPSDMESILPVRLY